MRNGPAVRAAAVVFIASFCTLVIEIVAGRVLAPHVGVSLYTWTSIIGVVLAGISAGAWAGGVVADRRPQPSTLGWLLLAAGITALLIGPATTFLAEDGGILTELGIAMTLLQRVVVLSFLLFFLPALFLGMISPVAVKIALRDLASSGRVVGKIYAFSTLGSILGTFVTGFYLIARFGTRSTLIGVGAVLIASAIALGDLFGRRARIVAVLVIAAAAAQAGLWPGALPPPYQDPLRALGETGVIHTEESAYYTINVDRTLRRDTGSAMHALHLDHLVHSYTDVEDPSHLEYGYLVFFRQIIDARAARGPSFRLLFVGGGGYTLPRLVDRVHPGAEVDVIEIDPAVTRVAHRYFGLPRESSVRTFNQDARWFAINAAVDGKSAYDAIFIDAFNDLSVPYHLTTREHTLDLQRLLTGDGVLAANVIDDFPNGRFLASYVKTLQSVFGDENVTVLLEEAADRENDRSTFVVVASPRLASLLGQLDPMEMVHGAELRRYVEERKGIVLTDDYAPVDNMLAPLFTTRFVDESE